MATQNNGSAIAEASRGSRPKSRRVPEPVREVKVGAPEVAHITVKIRGLQPLLICRWSEKATEQMMAKHTLQAKAKKGAKQAYCDALDRMHLISERPDARPTTEKEFLAALKGARFGFPAIAIKKAMVAGARHVDGLTMTGAMGSFFVFGDDVVGGEQLLELKPNGPPRCHEGYVRNASGVADIRHRPMFDAGWTIDVKIRYLSRSISPEMLVALLVSGGFSNGLGERRAERTGDVWGQFEVVTD